VFDSDTEEDTKQDEATALDRFGDRLDGKDSDWMGRRVDAGRKKEGDKDDEEE
jgi:hypothetical protein